MFYNSLATGCVVGKTTSLAVGSALETLIIYSFAP